MTKKPDIEIGDRVIHVRPWDLVKTHSYGTVVGVKWVAKDDEWKAAVLIPPGPLRWVKARHVEKIKEPQG